ncbi:unnamed protein product [Didymodactylos carnosus]|uniref:C2H2-type domain-containing protein n=1 Tax=Didymodactylos carnosus TaxID=1234261 RepID=A0A813VVN8_9BILA|nr:unnamed protein product [Didymodactylos carnosus]CAF0957444.1 unnamed protein product [Didymodactylos carnosus]CAF3634753.1 unnamed protein product [Didymodactylos carnosus]CAF3730523.1 unnamed protein product [Didymodactylos carnosus]
MNDNDDINNIIIIVPTPILEHEQNPVSPTTTPLNQNSINNCDSLANNNADDTCSSSDQHENLRNSILNKNSNRRKQSKPNRLAANDRADALPSTTNTTPSADQTDLASPKSLETESESPTLKASTSENESSGYHTLYHVAASMIEDEEEEEEERDTCDRISLNCEDGSCDTSRSPSSYMPEEHYAMEDIINRTSEKQQRQRRNTTDMNGEQQERNVSSSSSAPTNNNHDEEEEVLDFSLKEKSKTSNGSLARTVHGKINTSSKAFKKSHHNQLSQIKSMSNNMIVNGMKRQQHEPKKIFHADAFCAICRKEFCNKYFLKTHLANKHGIFDQSSSPTATTTTTTLTDSPPNSLTVISTLLNANDINDLNDLSSHRRLSSPSSMIIDEDEGLVVGNETENETDLPSHCLDDGTNSTCSVGGTNSGNDGSILNTSLSGTPTSKSSAKLPEDFCDLCQKHFCNKYYLRKHKLDVHGVYTDCNIKPYKRIDNSTKNSQQSQQQQPQNTSQIQSSSSTTTQQNTSIISTNVPVTPQAFSNVSFNSEHLFISVVENAGAYTVAAEKVKESSVQQSLGLLLNPIFSPLIPQLPSNFASLKRDQTTSSTTSTSSSNVLEAAQYLTVASDVANAFASQLLASAATANTISTSTTNGTNTSSTTPATNKYSRESLDSNTNENISTCYLCGKKFQSNDFLHLHMINKHGLHSGEPGSIISSDHSQQQHQQKTTKPLKQLSKIKLEPNETLTTTTTSVVIKSPQPNLLTTTSNSTSQATPVISGIVDTYFAAKMADRVSCDVCHKQVCNKYFLKTHKLKVHGASVIENGASNDDYPSIKSEPQIPVTTKLENENTPLIFDINSTSAQSQQQSAEPGAILVVPSPDELTSAVSGFYDRNNGIDETFEEIQCDVCSKPFKSKFLLHVHLSNVHGIQQQSAKTVTENETISTTSTTATKSSRRLSNNNSKSKSTPQVQLRVTCQVCKKELCNKYFLRAHMSNVHNISLDDLRLMSVSSSTSSSSTSNTSISKLSNTNHRKSLSSSAQNISLTSIIPQTTTIIVPPTKPSIMKAEHSQSLSPATLKCELSVSDGDEDEQQQNQEGEKLTNGIHRKYSTEVDFNQDEKGLKTNTDLLLSMQPFLVESDDDLYKDLFVPCMVYLPVKSKLTKPLQVSLKLKPVDALSGAEQTT